MTKTTDPDVFLQALDAITLDDNSCCCTQEPFWDALQLALINTPDYSTIFCFTDAGGNDAEIMEGVIAMASSKGSKVRFLFLLFVNCCKAAVFVPSFPKNVIYTKHVKVISKIIH